MLSDNTREILTAYLDGELSGSQRKSVMEFLQRSSEARSFLQQLQEGASQLHKLPRKKLPADFSDKVMQAIAKRGLRPGQGASQAPRQRGWSQAVRLAIAATVLFAVGLGSVAIYSWLNSPQGAGPIAKVEAPIEPPPLVNVRVPIAEFHRPQAKEQLTQELKKDASFQLDLAVANTTRAVQHVEKAFQGAGVKVLIDAPTQAQLNKDQPKKSYVVYVENVRAEDVIGILEKLSDETVGSSLQTALLHPLSARDRGELARVLGVPETKLAPAPRLDEQILSPIHEPDEPELKSKGRPRPVPTPEPQRLAVVLPYTQGAGSPSSEVQRFLANRPQPRPGTLQFVVVLQEAAA